MTEVEIEYCVPCGHRNYAIETADTVLEGLGRDLEEVEITPSSGGVFNVFVDGEQIFDIDEDAYDPEAIAEDVAERA